MLVLLVGFLVGTTILAAAVSKAAFGRILSPISAFPLSFFASASAYGLFQQLFFRISLEAVLAIMLGVSLYIAGATLALLAQHQLRVRPIFVTASALESPRTGVALLLVLSGLAWVATAVHLERALAQTGASSLVELYTKYLWWIDRSFLISGWAYLWDLHMLVVVLAFAYAAFYPRYRTVYMLFGLSSLIGTLLKGDIYYVAMPLLSGTVANILASPSRRELRGALRQGSLVAVLVVGVFIAIYVIYFKELQAAVQQFALYASGSLVGLGGLIGDLNGGPYGYGRAFFKQPLGVLGMAVSLHGEFREVGPSSVSNVASVLGTLFVDGGWLGVSVGSLVLGAIGVILFDRWARRRTLSSLLLVSFHTSASLLAFFGNLYGFIVIYYFVLLAVGIEAGGRLWMEVTRWPSARRMVD